MSGAQDGGLGRLFDLSIGTQPVDLSSAAVTGRRVHLKNYKACTIVVLKGAGTAGDDPTFDVKQHTASTGGTSADLDVVTKYYVKAEATLDGDETWTKVTQSAASEIVDPGGATTSAEEQQIVAIEINQDQLSDGYEWISLDIADVGTNAQLGAVLYILHGLTVQRSPEKLAEPLT